LALNALFKLYAEEVTMFKNAREKVQRRPVDLILCDFQMPKMNGIEMITRLRGYITRQNQLNEMVQLIEPHIVICSAYLTQQLKKHMVSVGINNFHEKPLPIEALDELI
jgi:CheY-like chemotaxis protein